MTQVKVPEKVAFKSLRESSQDPEFVFTDFGKFDHPATVHTAYAALDIFIAEQGRRPNPWDEADAGLLIEIAERIKPADAELKTSLLKIFSYVCSGNLAPVNGFIGGVVAQEVIKSFLKLQCYFWNRFLSCVVVVYVFIGDESLQWEIQSHPPVVVLRCN